MNIEREDNGKKGSFFISENKERLGEMTYVWAGEKTIIIDHTEVDERLKGKNAGRQLLNKAVAFARENDIKIIPLCPFAKSVFDKTPDIHDVLRGG